MHMHDNKDEHFIVLEGTMRVANGDTISDALAGTAATGATCRMSFGRTHRGSKQSIR